jgi:hypothetical protein
MRLAGFFAAIVRGLADKRMRRAVLQVAVRELENRIESEYSNTEGDVEVDTQKNRLSARALENIRTDTAKVNLSAAAIAQGGSGQTGQKEPTR